MSFSFSSSEVEDFRWATDKTIFNISTWFSATEFPTLISKEILIDDIEAYRSLVDARNVTCPDAIK